MRLETTIEELPQFPHQRPITQSTNHFPHHLGFRTSLHFINHVNFLGPRGYLSRTPHTYPPSNSFLPQDQTCTLWIMQEILHPGGTAGTGLDCEREPAVCLYFSCLPQIFPFNLIGSRTPENFIGSP